MPPTGHGPSQAIAAPPLAPAPNGLLSVVQVVDQRDGRFVNGVTWAPEPCGTGALFDPSCGVGVLNERQQLAVTGGPPEGGTFTLTFSGQTTAAIPFNATAAQVAAALSALSNIGPGNVTATGGPFPGTAIVVEFVGAMRGANQPQMTAADTFTKALGDPGDVTVTTLQEGSGGPTKDVDRNRGAAGSAWPVLVVFDDVCSTVGWRSAEYQARARRGLARVASWRVERELWTGALIDDNPNLSGDAGTTVPGGPYAPERALDELVQALADTAVGAGVIHARPYIIERWTENGKVKPLMSGPNAGKLATGTGHLVVAGTGYTGTGPAGQAVGATEWAYATDPLVVLRGDVVITPPDPPDGPPSAAAVDRGSNTVAYYAEQAYSVLWNRCAHLAVEITR